MAVEGRDEEEEVKEIKVSRWIRGTEKLVS